MSKKIIRLTESQLKNVIKRIIKEDEEEWVSQAQDIQKEDFYSTLIKSGPKPAVGGEYCFTKQDVNSIFKAGGYKGLEGFKNHYKLHLVKKGQTFNQIEDYEMASKLVDINRSKRCGSGLRKKELRAGDVLLVSILPGM